MKQRKRNSRDGGGRVAVLRKETEDKFSNATGVQFIWILRKRRVLTLQEGRERDKERERELNTHTPGGFSKFADHGMAAREKERVTTRGRENDPRRGWKSITER